MCPSGCLRDNTNPDAAMMKTSLNKNIKIEIFEKYSERNVEV